MSETKIIMLIVFGLIFFSAFTWSVYTYNQFIQFKNMAQSAWSDIDVYLTKRHELIPNLVEIVKEYMVHEKETLVDIINARNKAVGEIDNQKQIPIENKISGQLGNLFILSENYPEIKANTNFLKLHEQLTEVENDIANSRRYYNAVIRDNNNLVVIFPQKFIAILFGFKAGVYFQASSQARERLEVDL